MRGRAQRKVVTSGRLTGAVRGGLATLNPGTAPCPEPAYSLYSTDSEDQVISLHKGLDRCAALLSGILQADEAVSPRLHRTVSSVAVKPRLSTSMGKKSSKKGPPKAGQKSVSGQRGSDSRTPRGHPSARPAPHSGVKLHPPQKRCPTQLQSHLLSAHDQTPRLLPHTVSPPQHEASILLSVRQSSSLSSHQTACRPDSETPHTTCDEAQEFVPVRDTNTQSPSTHTLTHAHGDSCSMKMAHLQLEPGQAEESNTEAQTKAHKLQYLFAQLKALIAGQGSVAESLLSHLEQTVSPAQMNISASNTQSVSDLHRCVRILDQQPETERHQNQAILWQRLQKELTAAQSRLQELQDDLTDLQKTLQDTQSQLRDREAETALVKMELEASKSRLLDSEREKSKLASLAQQRLKEMEHLKSLLSSYYPAVVDSSVSETSQHQHRRDPPAPPTDHIAQYLKSLSQMAPVQCVDAERDSDSASHLDITAQRSEDPAGTRHESNRERSTGPGEALRPEDARRQLFNSTLSQSETESVWSDLTFDTRDEAAFRDGLAALDASIASLQKTIKLDLRR